LTTLQLCILNGSFSRSWSVQQHPQCIGDVPWFLQPLYCCSVHGVFWATQVESATSGSSSGRSVAN